MSDPIVTVKQGTLKGQVETNVNGGTYYSFKGVPFAEPPVGKLRFKAPRPPKPWNGVREAIKDSTPSKHKDMITGLTIGSEDCLYLNVFTPVLGADKAPLKPVLFWIHGGAFFKGSNSVQLYGADIFLTEDVVLVSTNYRLGALGFLGFTDPKVDAPGNNGLKDQVAALQWVQENITKFGGDPNNVTLFGESAGSASVNYLCLSDVARTLFNRAICQSGVALAEWANNKAQPEILAELVGYTGDKNDQQAMLEFLVNAPLDAIFEVQESVQAHKDYKGCTLPWAPIVEVDGCPTEPNFITISPEVIVENGDTYNIPMIIGYNSDEGLLMCSKETPPVLRALISCTINEYFVPPVLKNIIKNPTELKEVGDLIKKKYWGDSVPSPTNYVPFVKYMSDVCFISPINHAIKMHVNCSTAPIYVYRFSVDLETCPLKKQVFEIPFPGCTHAEELFYMFSNSFVKLVLDDSDAGKTSYRFVKFWTNFAKTGNPNCEIKDKNVDVNWKPFTNDEQSYLDFGLDLKSAQKPDSESLQFWQDLLKKYGVDKL